MKNRSKLLVAAIGVAMAGAGSLLLTTAQAGAVSSVLYHGTDWARVIDGSTGNDEVMVVCDAEADAKTVYVNYYTDIPGKGQMKLEDRSGANDGCHWHNMQGTPYRVTRFQLCEEDGGCTEWRVRGVNW